MHISLIMNKIREHLCLVAVAASLHPANNNKTEKGERQLSIKAVDKIAKLFGMTTDQIENYEGNIPT